MSHVGVRVRAGVPAGARDDQPVESDVPAPDMEVAELPSGQSGVPQQHDGVVPIPRQRDLDRRRTWWQTLQALEAPGEDDPSRRVERDVAPARAEGCLFGQLYPVLTVRPGVELGIDPEPCPKAVRVGEV